MTSLFVRNVTFFPLAISSKINTNVTTLAKKCYSELKNVTEMKKDVTEMKKPLFSDLIVIIQALYML